MTLSSKVAALTGPDRAVDAEAMFDLYAKPVGVSKIDGGPRGYLWPEDNPSWSFGLRFPGKSREWFAQQCRDGGGERLLIERDGALVLMNDLRVPPLTASLDAVASIEDGWAEIECYAPDDESDVFSFYGRDRSRRQYEGFGATEVLARLSAALAARGL